MKAAAQRLGSEEARALRHLKRADPVLHAALLPHREALVGSVPPRLSRAKLFERLAESVTGQQLSTKAADTIVGRLREACGGKITPEAIQKLRVPTLRKAGLSAAKVKTLKELSRAVLAGELDLGKLRTLPEEEAIAKLSSIWGIGRWTAEMFLLFALGREDVFSPGDLGLRRAVEALYGLPKDCPIRDLEAVAACWSPHRSYASRALWMIRDSG